MVELDLAPARLDKRDYEHDLRVVDLALGLTDYGCDGWISERMIRSRLKPGVSIGRVPDGLLLGPGGERWAIELEVSTKETQRHYDINDLYARRHREDMPDGSQGWDLWEQLDDYVETGGEIDGVAWYFFSEKKRRRALSAAERVIADRAASYRPTGHLNFRFCQAASPSPPPFEKWGEQQRLHREREERKRREQEEARRRREEERRQKEFYREAWNYLTEKERERALQAATENARRRGRLLTEWEKQRAIIDAGRAKYRSDEEREERRQRRKDALKNFFSG